MSLAGAAVAGTANAVFGGAAGIVAADIGAQAAVFLARLATLGRTAGAVAAGGRALIAIIRAGRAALCVATGSIATDVGFGTAVLGAVDAVLGVGTVVIAAAQAMAAVLGASGPVFEGNADPVTANRRAHAAIVLTRNARFGWSALAVATEIRTGAAVR